MFATSPSDRIDDYLRYVELVRGPDVLAKAEGASEEQIAKLRSVCPYPLPNLYIEWLRVFGRNEYGSGLDGDASYQIDSLTSAYETYGADDSMFPLNEELFSTGVAFYYQSPGSWDHPVVVQTCEGMFDGVLAQSYQNFLYYNATLVVGRPKNVPMNRVSLRSPDSRLTPQVSEILHELGYSGYWFNDSYRVIFDCDGVNLITLPSTTSTQVTMISHDGQKLAELSRTLTARLQLVDITARKMGDG